MLYRAYLPYTSDGLRVLHLLEKAFKQKLMFTIRASRGGSDKVVCGDIELKSSTYGGPKINGYPDPGYLERVTAQLATKGIR
ncbi:putative E3 ubiquitin-protein ligase DTX3 [Branchiostoma floridae x Branchiostoma japonicum]